MEKDKEEAATAAVYEIIAYNERQLDGIFTQKNENLAPVVMFFTLLSPGEGFVKRLAASPKGSDMHLDEPPIRGLDCVTGI